jgi:hypothetical protein
MTKQIVEMVRSGAWTKLMAYGVSRYSDVALATKVGRETRRTVVLVEDVATGMGVALLMSRGAGAALERLGYQIVH